MCRSVNGLESEVDRNPCLHGFVEYMVNPSSGSDKIVTSIALVIKVKVIQLTDFFRWKIVVGNALVMYVALLNALKPVDGFNSLKHMACE